MRVCGRFPNSPARATTVLGLEHFRATADGGVLALSFVTALLARPWKVGVPCQDHLRECSRRAAALWGRPAQQHLVARCKNRRADPRVRFGTESSQKFTKVHTFRGAGRRRSLARIRHSSLLPYHRLPTPARCPENNPFWDWPSARRAGPLPWER